MRWASVGATLIVVAWLVESAVYAWFLEGLRELQDRLGEPPAPAVVVTTYLYISSIVFLVGAQLDEFLREDGDRETELAGDPRQLARTQTFLDLHTAVHTRGEIARNFALRAEIASTASSASSANIRSLMAAQDTIVLAGPVQFVHTRCGPAATGFYSGVVVVQVAQANSPAAPVPPQNLEAEESVLGAMMLSPGAIGAVSEVLDAGDFYRESHAKIYRAALALYAKGEPVDAITLVDQLEERSELEDVGGRPRIHELAALVPATANAAHYARIVHEMGTLRGLIRVGQEIARLGWERPGETTDLLDQAEQVLFDLSQGRVQSEFSHIEELLKESFERITALYEAGVDVTGVPSGFRELDKLTSGFQPGNLIIVAARPSMGKSALALCAAVNIARAPRRSGRAVHARDVEVRGDAAADVQRGQGRVAAAAHRQARAGRLVAADRGVRQADEGADLRRRRRLDDDDGHPLEVAAAEVAAPEPRADRRRLPPADDVGQGHGEPRPGGVADLAPAQGARARPRRADPRAVAAVARRRAAPRQAADPLRPSRVGLASSRTPTS